MHCTNPLANCTNALHGRKFLDYISQKSSIIDMASQYLWLGIAAAFAAGIAVGYIVFLGSQAQMPMSQQQMMNGMMQNPQMMRDWTNQMMNSQSGRQQMMTSMMQNQEFMDQMMGDPQFQDQMISQMRQIHNFTQGMIMGMMDDPQIRTQMIGHMMENQEFMQDMQRIMGNQTASSGSMGSMR